MRRCRPPRSTSGCKSDPSVTHVVLVHCETGTGVENPLADIAARLRAPRQGPDRRRDVELRRAADRCAPDPLRRADRRQRQVPGRRAGHGLRVPAQGGARCVRRQQPEPGDGPARPACVHGKDRPVALHAADPCGGGAGRGGGAVRRRRRPAGAPGALCRQLQDADRRHESARLQGVPQTRDPGADHRDLPRAGRTRLTSSSVSTTPASSAASSSIPAS